MKSVDTEVVVVLIIFLLFILFGGFGMMGFSGPGGGFKGMANMMYGYYGYDLLIFGWIYGVLILASLLLLIVWLVKQIRK